MSDKRTGGCLGHRDKQEKIADLKEVVLLYSALEARNLNAGNALEAFYGLAEAEGRWEAAQGAVQTIDDAVTRAREMKAKGLKLPVELETLEQQRLGILMDRKQVMVPLENLGSQLIRLLGLSRCSAESRIFPVLEPTGPPAPVDCETAVAVGLANRPELNLLREVSQRLDADTLPVVREWLKVLSPLLGMSEKKPRCAALAKLALLLTHGGSQGADLETVRGQVQEYLAEREQAIAEDIRRDVRIISVRSQLVTLAVGRARQWQARVAELDEKRAKGLASFAETTTARLEWQRARSDLVRETATLERARVQLEQDQGVLALECGHGPSSSGACPTHTATPAVLP